MLPNHYYPQMSQMIKNKISNQIMTAKPHRVILDTDTFNEVDDQFALAHAALSPGHIKLEAVYAAPFHNARSAGPAEGMEKSYQEIFNVLSLLPEGAAKPAVFRGADRWLGPSRKPVESEAVSDLIQRALASPPDDPLQVVAIAAPTNIASALLIEPRIADHIRLIWLGGQPLYWPTAEDFNLRQDVASSQVLFEKAKNFLFIPCRNVAQHLLLTMPDLNDKLPPDGGLGDFLRQRFELYIRQKGFDSKPLWDVAAIAPLVNPGWLPFEETARPRLTDTMQWRPGEGRGTLAVATEINRDAIFADMFAKLRAAASGGNHKLQ